MEGDRGREGYARREEKGREAGLPKWRETGEKEKNFAVFYKRNRTKRWEPLRKRVESESKRYGKREFQTPPPLSPPISELIPAIIRYSFNV